MTLQMSDGKNTWKICRHCNTRNVNRPRGLCWPCYYKPGVRDLYPSTSKYARRGVSGDNTNRPLPDFKTEALTGTESKIQILELRAMLGQQLFHPEDAVEEKQPNNLDLS